MNLKKPSAPVGFHKERLLWVLTLSTLLLYLYPVHRLAFTTQGELYKFSIPMLVIVALGYNIFTPRKNGEYYRYSIKSWLFPASTVALSAPLLQRVLSLPFATLLVLDAVALGLLIYNFPRESHRQKYLAYMEKRTQKEPVERKAALPPQE